MTLLAFVMAMVAGAALGALVGMNDVRPTPLNALLAVAGVVLAIFAGATYGG